MRFIFHLGNNISVADFWQLELMDDGVMPTPQLGRETLAIKEKLQSTVKYPVMKCELNLKSNFFIAEL